MGSFGRYVHHDFHLITPLRSPPMHLSPKFVLPALAIALLSPIPPVIPAAPARATTLETAQAQPDSPPAADAQEIEGLLVIDSDTLDDGSHYEVHTFTGTEGQAVAIEMISEAFDTYLIVFDPEGNRIAENDDGDDSNARVWLTLPTTGIYTVWATSYGSGEVGNYRLSWRKDETLAELQQTLEVARESGDREAELEALFDIADFYQDRDQNLEALEASQAVLELAQELGNSDYELISYFTMSVIYNGIGIDKNGEASELYRAEQWQQALESAQQGVMAAQQAVQLARQGKARAEAVNSESFISNLTLAVPRSLATLVNSYQRISDSQQEQAIDLIAEQNYRQAESLEAESIAAAEKAVEAAQESLLLTRNSENFNDIYARDLFSAVNAVAQSHDMVGLALYRVRSLRLNNEGEFEQQVNALEQALAAYETALPFHREGEQLWQREEIIKAIGESEFQLEKEALLGIINVRLSLSSAYGELSRYQEGIAVAEQTIELARQLPSRSSELTALISLSNLYDYLGEQYLEAEAYEEALAAQEKNLFYAQEKLKVAQSFIDSPELSDFESNTYAERGIDIVESALLSIFNAYAAIREVYTAQDDYDSALEFSLKTLDISEQIENPAFLFSDLRALYVDYDRLSRYQEALEVSQRRLDLAHQLENQAEEFSALSTIASIQQDLGQYPEAIANYEEAQSLAIENGNLDEQRGILLNLGALYATQGDPEKASENYNQVLEMARAARQRLETANVSELESLAPECSILSLTPTALSLDIVLLPEFSGVDERRDIEQLERSRQRCIGSTWDTEQKALLSQATGYSEQGRYEEAIELYRRSLEIVRTHRPDDRVQEVSALNGIGATYADRGDYSIAIEEYLQALDIAIDINHQPSILLLRNNLGATFFEQGNYPAALEQLQQALTIAQETRLLPDEGYILSNIGRAYYEQGDYEKALEFFQRGLELGQQLGQKMDQAAVLIGFSLVQLDQGHYDQALDYAQQSLALFRETGVKASEADVLVLIGRIQFIRGNYAEAIDAKQQALTINQEIGDQDGEAYALQQLGTLYNQLGQYDRALQLNQRALEIAQRIGDRSREASTLDEIGNLYSQQGEYEQALAYYSQALTIWQDIDSPVGKARSLRNAGFVKEQLGRYGEAKADFQQSLALQRQIGARGHEGLTLNGLALAHAAQGEIPAALSALQPALVLHRELGDRPGQAQALSDLGKVYLQANRLIEAEGVLYEALDVLESLRASELKDTDKIALFDTQLAAYDTLQQVLVAQNDPAKVLTALEVAERGRARAFVDSLTVRLADTTDIADDVVFPDLAKIRQIAQQQNATLVEYAIVKTDTDQPEFYIWVVSPTGDISFRQQSLQGVDLASLVQSTRSSLGVRSRATLAFAYNGPTTEEQLQQLHQLLMAPIVDLLPTNPEKRVILIPQGDLFLVPFPALLNAEGQYLIERHTLLTAPSIQVLDLTRQRRQQLGMADQAKVPTEDVLIVGNPEMPTVRIPSLDWEGALDPLPGALAEAQEIATFFDTQAITGTAATEERIKQQMVSPQILHLATHGLLEYGLPGESAVRDLPGAIALTPSNGEDGLLTAAEIYDMNLNAELVVLSACDTGRGRITGDGVVGLSRAFISAGTPSVVVSLWSVPDAPTADLMVAFYGQLQQGQDKAQALRQAMLNTMAEYPEPKDWAAFTLIGEAD